MRVKTHLEYDFRRAVFSLLHAEGHRGDILRFQEGLHISSLRCMLALGSRLPPKHCCRLRVGKPLQA